MLVSRVGHVRKSHELVWWRGFWSEESKTSRGPNGGGQVGYCPGSPNCTWVPLHAACQSVWVH